MDWELCSQHLTSGYIPVAVPFIDMIRGPIDTILNVFFLFPWDCFCHYFMISLIGLEKCIPEKWIGVFRISGKNGYAELIGYWIGTAIMMLTVQPLLFRSVFR